MTNLGQHPRSEFARPSGRVRQPVADGRRRDRPRRGADQDLHGLRHVAQHQRRTGHSGRRRRLSAPGNDAHQRRPLHPGEHRGEPVTRSERPPCMLVPALMFIALIATIGGRPRRAADHVGRQPVPCRTRSRPTAAPVASWWAVPRPPARPTGRFRGATGPSSLTNGSRPGRGSAGRRCPRSL